MAKSIRRDYSGVFYKMHVLGTIQCTLLMVLVHSFALQLLRVPDFRSGSAYYAAQEAASDVGLLEIEPCLPRSVSLSGVREQCRDIVFALSVEFYGQVFGK